MAFLLPLGWLPVVAVVMLARHDPAALLRASVEASVQSIQYRNANDFQSALAASQRALEFHQQSGIRENLDLQWAAVAENLRSLGRLDEALAAYRQAQSLQTGTTTARATVWRDIVLTEISLGRLDDAERNVIAFMKAASAAPPAFQAESRIALSDLRMASGRHADAVEAIREAVELAHSDPAEERIRLEALAQLMVCVVDAMRILPYDQAMALAQRMDTENPGLLFPVAPFARRAIHVRRRLAGEFDAVLREELEARKAAQRAGKRDAEIEVLRSMAATYGALNDHEQEIAALSEAARLCREALPSASDGTHILARARLVGTLAALGEAYLAAAQPMRADETFSAAIDEATGVAAHELARAWIGRARAALASERTLEAREILDRALSGGIPGADFDRGELFLLRARAEPPGASSLASSAAWFDRSAEAFRTARDGPQETRAHLSAARFFLEPALSRSAVTPFGLTEATKHLRMASVLAGRLSLGGIRWQITFLEGLRDEVGNDSVCALLSYRQAMEELDRLRSSLSDDQRASLLDTMPFEALYAHTLGLLTKTAQPEEAWILLEHAKARTFLEMLHGRRRRPEKRPVVDDEVSRLEKRILDLRVALAPENVGAVRGSGRDPASMEQSLRQLEQRFQLARERLDEAPGQRSIHPLAPDAIQKRLPSGTALLAYGFLPDGVTVFIVTRDGMKQRSWTTSIAELRTGIARLREALADPDSDEHELRASISLVSDRVLHPALEALAPGVERLVIVPTGPLAYVPFQVLTTRAGVPLIERLEISYLPNAGSLELLGRRGRERPGTLFVGALGGLSVEGLDPLPGTLAEARAIGEIQPGARLATEQAFTKSVVLEAFQRDTIVHLATHSVLHADAPMFSAILTAPEQSHGSRISLYEIMDLDLAARLVVLSACETGLGRFGRGDEITGLTRTFLIAGAETVVSSLWEVSDEATILLMRIFYEELDKARSPSQALRRAALAVRERHPHPMHWAPFIVTGAPPLEE